MKVLLLLLFFKMVNTQTGIFERINDIVLKYEFESRDNPEFFAWIEELKRIVKAATYTVMDRTLRDFEAYDKQRQHLEERILVRIEELDSLFPDRRLSQECVDDYLDQKKALIQFKIMSNAEKNLALDQNSRNCYLVIYTQKPHPTKPTFISTSTDPGTTMTSIATTTSPAVTKYSPIRIESPYVPIINHC